MSLDVSAQLGTTHPAAQRHTSEELNPHDNSFLASDFLLYWVSGIV